MDRIVLYIKSKRAVLAKNFRWFYAGISSEKYTVVSFNDESFFRRVMFSSDNGFELKVYLDCMGLSMGSLLFDSCRQTPSNPPEVNGVLRGYELFGFSNPPSQNRENVL